MLSWTTPPPSQNFPTIRHTLKRVIIDLSRQRDEWKHEERLEGACASRWRSPSLRLEVELLRLKKWYYGPKADRLSTPGEVAQMLLAFATGAGSSSGESRRSGITRCTAPRSGNESHPARSPRAGGTWRPSINCRSPARNHDLPDDQKPCPCCGKTRERSARKQAGRSSTSPAASSGSSTCASNTPANNANKTPRIPTSPWRTNPLRPSTRAWPVRACWRMS